MPIHQAGHVQKLQPCAADPPHRLSPDLSVHWLRSSLSVDPPMQTWPPPLTSNNNAAAAVKPLVT